MRKVLFLMFLLLLMGLGAAGVKAQVRIGGNGSPNAAAVLDLNATDATNNGTKGLALPRVSLSSNTAQITSGVANLIGMLVYNTSGSLSTGVYYWSGTNWNRVDGATLGGDTIVGNEVTNATANGGLVRTGSGTAASPYTLGINLNGVTPAMLAKPASPGAILYFDGSSWIYAYYTLVYSYNVRTTTAGTTFSIPATSCRTKPIIDVEHVDAAGIATWVIASDYSALTLYSNIDNLAYHVIIYCWK